MIKNRLRELSIQYLDLYPYRRYMTKNKCIFVHIPKAAGTSVLQALAGHTGHIRRDHVTVHNCLSASRIRFEEYYKFTVVREPSDRIRSVYRYLVAGGNKTTDRSFSAKISSSFKTLDEFVFDFLDHATIHSVTLIKPQYTFLCDSEFNVLVDFVGRFENLEADFNLIADKLGLRPDLPKLNRGSSDLVELSVEAELKIKELYMKDYELFYPSRLA